MYAVRSTEGINLFKRTAALIVSVVIALFMCGCSQKNLTTADKAEREIATGESWTIMVYMSGGQTESVYGKASDALEEMTKIKYPENINVLVQTGGTYSWQLGGIDTNYINRFEMQNKSMRLAERQELDSMGKSSTLESYIEWGRDNYSADHYALIIYGAGAGSAYGISHDDVYMGDCLNPQRIATAISNAGMQFDIIGFDAGLTASIENAAALSTYTDYIIASQEEMAPGGWNYRGWINYIIENPTASLSDVAKAVCDTYMDKCKRQFSDEMATMSVIDTERISMLSQAFDGMAGEMQSALDTIEDYSYLSSEMADVLSFGANTEDEGYSNMVDIRSFSQCADRITQNTSSQVSDAINESVIYKVCGEYRHDASGISVYYPLREDSSELERYIDIAPIGSYTDFLRKICSNVEMSDSGTDGDYSETDAFNDYERERNLIRYATVAGTTGFELNMTGDMDVVRDVYQRLFYRNEDGIYLYLGNTDSIDENKEAGIFKTKNEFKALTMNGHYIQIQRVCSGDGYTIYSSPVKVDGEQYNLRLVRTENNGKIKFKCIGLYRSIGNANQSQRTVKKIRIYNKVTALLRDYSSGMLVESDGFKTWPFGMRLKYDGLKDGNYKTDFIVSYIYEDSFFTGSADFSVSEGTIAYQ